MHFVPHLKSCNFWLKNITVEQELKVKIYREFRTENSPSIYPPSFDPSGKKLTAALLQRLLPIGMSLVVMWAEKKPPRVASATQRSKFSGMHLKEKKNSECPCSDPSYTQLLWTLECREDVFIPYPHELRRGCSTSAGDSVFYFNPTFIFCRHIHTGLH